MKILGWILTAGLVMGCASQSTKNGNMAPIAANSNIIYLAKADRNPAAAPELRWNPGVLKVEVSSASASGKANVTINQEMIWKELEQFQDTRNEYREYEVPGNCSDFVCSATAGTGKSALWDAYFSAPREKRAAALANAIQGIGPASAEDLVARKYFTAKPRNWSEFAAEINRAGNAGVIKKSVATSVLNNYKYENIANLGYSRESCREEVRSCSVVISKLVPVPFTNSREVERRRVVTSKQYTVTVSVSDAVLMSGEKDLLTLKVDENGRLIAMDSSGSNRYAVANQSTSGNDVNIQLKSESRILRDLSNNVVRQDAYQLVGSQAIFVLDVESAYIPTSEDPNSQLVVDYTVRVCKYGWTGLCWGSWENLSMASAPITASRLALIIKVPAKHKSEISYTISRKNSRFFNDRPIREKSTDSVKMP